ncbi:MAG: GntR family transcriptional regulator [Myxococcales bacterium]|jgi:DNA-binding FadR family transcriptional regulator
MAEHVFDVLAKDILGGRLRPDEPLPTQRELAKQFHVSTLVVHQAIHRLEDLGLVRVRQGSATTVLDPRRSSDMRLIQLQMELATFDNDFALAVMEHELLFLCPLIVLAERRITREDLAVLNYIVDRLPEEPTFEEKARFRVEYWTRVAEATGNPLFGQQLRWWGGLITKVRPRRPINLPARQVLPPAFYRELTASFARGEGTLALYLETIGPVLERFDGAAQSVTPVVGLPRTDGIGAAPTRQRVADRVFDALAKSILEGGLEPDAALPTQRELAQQFHVSTLVIRQAIHRLEDLGLVRARQGSPTIVLDWSKSSDVRLIQLRLQLGTFDEGLARAVVEHQLLLLCPLIVLAQRRITREQVAVLTHIVDALPRHPTLEDRLRLRVEYWTHVAEATRNPLFVQQLQWWGGLITHLRPRRSDRVFARQVLPRRFYRNVTASLAGSGGALALYLEAIEPVLERFDKALHHPATVHNGAGQVADDEAPK